MELNFLTTFIKHDVNYNVKKCFKTKKPFVIRKEEVIAIKNKFPNKIPLIVERYHKERTLPSLDKAKFLVPEEITMSQFLVIIRNRMRIQPSQALYLIINNRSMLSMSLTMAQAYEQFTDEDGFLYVTYASQEVFGYQDDITPECQEVKAIRTRFPNKIPLYVERFERERDLPSLERKKFLVPQELTMSQFLFIIRSKMKLRDSQFHHLRMEARLGYGIRSLKLPGTVASPRVPSRRQSLPHLADDFLRLYLTSSVEALYLIVNNRVLISHSMTMAQAYQEFRREDGFLHITYAAQQVFG